jgi:hypothetical protein
MMKLKGSQRARNVLWDCAQSAVPYKGDIQLDDWDKGVNPEYISNR